MSAADDELIERARGGDRIALADLFARHRGRLEALVALRLDPHLRGRLDAGDVLQEAWLDVGRRFDEWLAKPDMPLYLWIRFLTVQKLAELHRRHGAKQRDARREVALHAGPSASTHSVAEHLAGSFSSPSQGLARQEVLARVTAALDALEEIDREVLVLRHFEELSNNEVAEVLGITKAGASNRYVRALKRLRAALEGEA
jgi:RNA polymerase sigma-70 factor (ECF subfamily)